MPRKANFPRPKKRYHRGTWEILWNWNSKRYSVFPGFSGEADEQIVEGVLRQIAACLASTEPVFSDDLASAPGVAAYLRDRYGIGPSKEMAVGDWLLDYEPHIMQEVVPTWAKPSLAMLRKLNVFTKGKLKATTPDQAQGFLDSLLRSGLKPARRNRALIMCNRFFKWAVRTKRTRLNPFEGIKLMKEARDGDITYCTKDERSALIAIAKQSKRSDWLAVPIAFYAGMRREEIYRMAWEDVDLENKRIVVPITKTKRLRRIPMNKTLVKILSGIAASRRKGQVCIPPAGKTEMTNRGHSLIELLRRKAKIVTPPIAQSKIGWNIFRHTFGSHLAQEGVTLDKITAWMGNTPEVCRRHYAQFVPTDRHDKDIEKL